MTAKNKNLGFTLAEVLITLAIIGVVAALTIPTLVNNYQKKVWATTLAKDYSTILNSVKLYMANNDSNKINYENYLKDISNYLKIQSIDDTNLAKTYDWNGDVFILHDGACFILNPAIDNLQTLIDVNCDKEPNIAGRDRFMFYLDTVGRLDSGWHGVIPNVLSESGVDSSTTSCDKYGDAIFNTMGIDKDELSETQLQTVNAELSIYPLIGCFDILNQNGWKMDY